MAPKKSAGGAAAQILTPEEPPVDGPIPPIPAPQTELSISRELTNTMNVKLEAMMSVLLALQTGQTRLETRVSLLERPAEQPPVLPVPAPVHADRDQMLAASELTHSGPLPAYVSNAGPAVDDSHELSAAPRPLDTFDFSAQNMDAATPSGTAYLPQEDSAPYANSRLQYTYRGSAQKLPFPPQETMQGTHQYVLSLPSPPPFMAKLTSLRDPHHYWTFEEDYGHYQMVYPHQAPHMRLVNYVDKSLLIGTLLLGKYFTNQYKHLLTDEVVRASIADHFRRAITTRAQFLDCIESISFTAPPLPRYLAHPEADLQPALTYLHQVDKFYNLLSEMCPQAVPLEENYDRARRTSMKYIVDESLSPWLPFWKQQVFDDVSKMKLRWPQISAHIVSRIVTMQKHLSVSAYIYAAIDRATPRLNPETATRKEVAMLTRSEPRPGFNRPRVLWDPSDKPATPKPAPRPTSLPAPRSGAATPARHSGPALHAIEGDEYGSDGDLEDDHRQSAEDDLSADTLSYYTPTEEDVAHVNALAGVPQVCFTAIRGEPCSKPGCNREHSKAAVDRQLREWRTANDKRSS